MDSDTTLSAKSDKGQPRRLSRNVRFPTYQLYAVIESRKNSPETTFQIAILECLSWVRKKFQNLEPIIELSVPESVDYKMLEDDMLKSFHTNKDYDLEVVYIKKDSIWTMRLIEPDSGLVCDDGISMRPPVVGRRFETDIAFRIHQSRVVCGFRTVCIEPEDTKPECEVIRMAIVKSMVRNPLLGLRQEFLIDESAFNIDTNESAIKVKNFISSDNRQLPLVIISEYFHKPEMNEITEQLANQGLVIRGKDLPLYLINKSKGKEYDDMRKWPFNTVDIVKRNMGYAQFCMLHEKALNEYNKLVDEKHKLLPGAVRIIYPIKSGKTTDYFEQADFSTNLKKTLSKIESEIRNYSKKREICFGSVCFLNDAKIAERDVLIRKMNLSVDEMNNLEISKKLIEKKYNELINELRTNCNDLIRKNEKLLFNNGVLQDEKNQLKKFCESIDVKENDRLKTELNKSNMLINYYKRKLKQPTRLDGISLWVEEYFNQEMCFHEKAVDLLEKYRDDGYDVNLICDALECIALEWRDLHTGRICESEMNDIMSFKYSRRFEICPSGVLNTIEFSKEYKVKLHDPVTNKKHERALDWHLKVGTGRHLIRIYFLYDESQRKVVIGSLPKHLPVRTFDG